MPNFPSNPYVGQIVSWEGKFYQWTGTQWVVLTYPPAAPFVKVSASPPTNPSVGNLWFNTLDQSLYVFVAGAGGGSWRIGVDVEDPVVSPPVSVSASPPPNPIYGNLWFDTIHHVLKVFVPNGGSGEWENTCEAEPVVVPPVIVSASPPSNPLQGNLWFNTIDNSLYVFTDGLDGGDWEITIDTTPTPETPPATVSSSPPINPVQGDLWFNPTTQLFKIFVGVVPTGGWESALFGEPDYDPPVTVSSSPPPNPVQGNLWYDTIHSILKVYRDGLGGNYWEDIQGGGTTSFEPPVVISVSPPPGAEPGTLWFDTTSGLFNLRIHTLGGNQWICPTQGPPGPEGPTGPVGPPGPIASSLEQLIDVNSSGKTDKSIMYYDAATSLYKFDAAVTIPDITDGGNF